MNDTLVEVAITRGNLLYVLGGCAILIAFVWFISMRRNFKFWRKIWGHDWHRLIYKGESTCFPTRRKENEHVWITPLEVQKLWYVNEGSGCRLERGRITRMQEAAARVSALHTPKAEEPPTPPVEQPSADARGESIRSITPPRAANQ